MSERRASRIKGKHKSQTLTDVAGPVTSFLDLGRFIGMVQVVKPRKLRDSFHSISQQLFFNLDFFSFPILSASFVFPSYNNSCLGWINWLLNGFPVFELAFSPINSSWWYCVRFSILNSSLQSTSHLWFVSSTISWCVPKVPPLCCPTQEAVREINKRTI